MKHKKIIFIILALLCVLMAGKLISNSVKNKDNDKTIINLWHPLTGGDGEFLQKIVQDFNQENEEYTIKMSVFKWDDYNGKLANGIASDEGPDIAIARNSFYSFLKAKDMLLPISDLQNNIEWDNYDSQTLEIVRENKKYYGSPMDIHPVVMFYNKDILAKANVLDQNELPKFENSEQGFLVFLNQIQKVQSLGEYPIALPTYSKSAEQWYLWNTWYSQNGGTGLLNKELTEPQINLEAFRKGASFEQKLFEKPFILPNDTDFTQTFTSGRAAIVFTGVWATAKFDENIENLGVVRIPNLWNDSKLSYAGSHVLMIPKTLTSERKQDGAIKFIEYFNEHSIEWAKAGHIPANKKIWETTEFLNMPFRKEFIEIGQNVQFVENQQDIFNLYENIVSPTLESIWRRNLSVDEGYEELTKRLEFQLGY